MNNPNVKDLITSAVADFNEQAQNKIDLKQGSDAPLFGQKGVLSSLELVSLTIALEQELEDQLSVSVTLANERAMSQKNSPFRTLGSLIAYAEELVAEQNKS
jgi:D-alanine--poly(phosphoribitol) ligase subunit 2